MDLAYSVHSGTGDDLVAPCFSPLAPSLILHFITWPPLVVPDELPFLGLSASCLVSVCQLLPLIF